METKKKFKNLFKRKEKKRNKSKGKKKEKNHYVAYLFFSSQLVNEGE